MAGVKTEAGHARAVEGNGPYHETGRRTDVRFRCEGAAAPGLTPIFHAVGCALVAQRGAASAPPTEFGPIVKMKGPAWARPATLFEMLAKN